MRTVLNLEISRRRPFVKGARDNQPDHGSLLAHLARWAARDTVPLRVDGAGFIDCRLYRQADRLILHLVNLTNAGTWRGPVDELIRVGPFDVRLRIPGGMRTDSVPLLVARRKVEATVSEGWLRFQLPDVLDHEAVVVG